MLNSLLTLSIISSNRESLICKVVWDGTSLRIRNTSSAFLWPHRMDLTRIPIVPWTLNPNCSATIRAEASSVRKMACGFCSISANASVSPASNEKIWHKVKSSSFTGIFPGELVLENGIQCRWKTAGNGQDSIAGFEPVIS
jgi:hypothetical protein